jgi:hypothetical protein
MEKLRKEVGEEALVMRSKGKDGGKSFRMVYGKI